MAAQLTQEIEAVTGARGRVGHPAHRAGRAFASEKAAATSSTPKASA